MALTYVFRVDNVGAWFVPVLFLSPALRFQFDADTLICWVAQLQQLKHGTPLNQAMLAISVTDQRNLKAALHPDPPQSAPTEDNSDGWLSAGIPIGPAGKLPHDALQGLAWSSDPRFEIDIQPHHFDNWLEVVGTQLDRAPLNAQQMGELREAEPWLLLHPKIRSLFDQELPLPAEMDDLDAAMATVSFLCGRRDRRSSAKRTMTKSGKGRHRGIAVTANRTLHYSTSLLLSLLKLQESGRVPKRTTGIRRLHNLVRSVLCQEPDTDIDQEIGKERAKARTMESRHALLAGLVPMAIPLDSAAIAVPSPLWRTGPRAMTSYPVGGSRIHTYEITRHDADRAIWAAERLDDRFHSPWLQRLCFVISGGFPDIIDRDQ